MSDNSGELLVEHRDGLAILRLNRPERLNALAPSLLRRLEVMVPALVNDSAVRALMLTGNGRAFCAGGDVSTMGSTFDRATTLQAMRAYHPWLSALWTCDKLVITAVNGAAAGGGFGLAMIGDVVVAAESAFFKAAFATLGVAPDFALGFTLPRVVGATRAADILLSDRRIPAREALELGIVSRVFADGAFADDALHYAQSLARASRSASLTKRLLRFEQREAFMRYLELEAQIQTEAFESQDFREGVAAFRERRPPNFKGC
jgi:2-(1,2-epoxy-1,2-dihydrophenyl)acetyl-CoA isomerase